MIVEAQPGLTPGPPPRPQRRQVGEPGIIRRRTLAEPVLVRHDELDAHQPEALMMLAAAVTGIGEEQAAGVRAGQGEDAFTLVLTRGPQVVAERGAAAIADEQQAHAADGDELGEAELHARDLRHKAPQAAVVLRLPGKTRTAARQQPSDGAEELTVGGQAGDRLGARQGDGLLIRGLPRGPQRGIDSEQANT